jgi:hypothetical protein
MIFAGLTSNSCQHLSHQNQRFSLQPIAVLSGVCPFAALRRYDQQSTLRLPDLV